MAIQQEKETKDELLKRIREAEAELSTMKDEDDRFKLADQLHSLGVLYHRLDDPLKAQDYYQKALPLYKDLGRELEMGQIFHLIGSTYEMMEQYTKARHFYYESLQLGEKTNSNLLLGEGSFRLANLAEQRGDYDLAVEYYRKSIELSKKVGYLVGHNNAFKHLAFVLERKGDLSDAVEVHIDALDFSDLDEDPPELVSANFKKIVELLENLKDLPRALEYQRRYVSYCEDRNLPETDDVCGKLEEMEIRAGKKKSGVREPEKDDDAT